MIAAPVRAWSARPRSFEAECDWALGRSVGGYRRGESAKTLPGGQAELAESSEAVARGRREEIKDLVAQLLPNLAVGGDAGLARAFPQRWVGDFPQAQVAMAIAGKALGAHACVIGERDHDVERIVGQRTERLGLMARHVDADLAHHFGHQRVGSS